MHVACPNVSDDKFAVKAYKLFCYVRGLPLIPDTTLKLHRQIHFYLLFRFDYLNGTGGSISQDVTDIRNFMASRGVDCNPRQYWPIAQVIKAAKNLRPSHSKTKQPLELWQIQQILNLLDIRFNDDLIMLIMLKLIALGAFRVCEVTHKPSQKPIFRETKESVNIDSTIYLLRYDRIFVYESKDMHFIIIWMYRSKTNRNNNREFVTIPCACKHGLCVVNDVKLWISRVKNLRSNTVLPTWSNGKYVKSDHIRYYLVNAAYYLNFDGSKIGTHSLRKFTITEAVRQGASDILTCQLARHASFSSIFPYIRLGPFDLVKARMNIGNDVNRTNYNSIENFRFRAINQGLQSLAQK